MNFKDNAGREWPAIVNTSALKRVRDALGVNLADASRMHETWGRFNADDLFVAEVALELVRPLLDGRKVTPEDFLDSLSGDVIKGAAIAIVAAWKDFFRDPAIRRVIEKLNQHAAGELLATIEEMVADMDRIAEARAKLAREQAKQTASSNATGSPAPLE